MSSGGPAFPVAGPFGSVGITVRDYFAAKVLQGLLASGRTNLDASVGTRADEVAVKAYAMADAMIRASGRREE